MNARDLLNKMAEAEEGFLRSTFIAPVVKGSGVRIRLEGIVWEFRVVPAEFEGWAVLKPRDRRTAEVTGEPRLGQVRDYLALFPMVPLVLCERRGETWWGLAAESGDRRFRLEGPVPVFLARDAQLFDTVRTRWDGARFLFEGRHPRRDPSVAAYLRESLAEGRRPQDLTKATLTPPERTAYEWQRLLEEQQLRDTTEERLRAAVLHADGRFRSFVERRDHYAVTFVVDGQPHTATIRKEDLSVMAAGICLSGQDAKFDLTSLVGVLREGQEGQVVRVGEDGLPEVDYWRLHPRRGWRR